MGTGEDWGVGWEERGGGGGCWGEEEMTAFLGGCCEVEMGEGGEEGCDGRGGCVEVVNSHTIYIHCCYQCTFNACISYYYQDPGCCLLKRVSFLF